MALYKPLLTNLRYARVFYIVT